MRRFFMGSLRRTNLLHLIEPLLLAVLLACVLKLTKPFFLYSLLPHPPLSLQIWLFLFYPFSHQLTISISINPTSPPFCSSKMASCFLPLQHTSNSSEEQKKLAKKMKSKEYYSTLMLAKKLFTRFSFSWFPKKSNKDVEISSLLKKLYDNRPTSASPAKSFGSVPISSTGEQGVKRIKVIITKQQLQELLSKEIQLEDVLPTSETSTTLLSCITSDKWKPELDSIPEGNEL